MKLTIKGIEIILSIILIIPIIFIVFEKRAAREEIKDLIIYRREVVKITPFNLDDKSIAYTSYKENLDWKR